MSRPAAKVLIVVLEVLQALSLPAWLFGAVFAVSALGESTANAGTYVAVGLLWSYPVWLIGLGMGSWVLLRRGQTGAAVALAALASVPLVLFTVVTIASL
ncbi:MAG: hypothetical protein MUE31_00065 [Candidatus Nanopelagicales bacterium]|jgi:hypothetical protein|nr:hypothetical protein [Candidatus Nanopelagicales bacterium]